MSAPLSFSLVSLLWLVSGLLLLSCHVHSASSSNVVFGMSGPFTGSNSFLGHNTYAGVNAAFFRSNRLSALPVNLSLVALDDGYDPTVALSNIQRLATEHNLLGVLGAVGTPTVQSILPFLTNYSIPLYGPVTGVRSLRHPFVSNVVNVRGSYDDECEAIVRLCLELGRLRVSIFYQNDGFGQAGLSGLQLALSARGLAILSNASYVRNTLDVQAGLQQLLASIVPQAVLCVGVGPACGAFINAALSNDSVWATQDIAYFALSFVAAESLADALLPTSLAPIYVSQVVPSPYPSNSTTAAASLANEYNAELWLSCPSCVSSFAGLEGYIAGKLVSSALQFNPGLVAAWTAQSPDVVSVNSSTMAARLAFANGVLEQGMLPAGGTVRQGPFGPACTGDEYDGLGFCGCNQGGHVIFLTQLNQSTSTFVDLPQSVYTFVDCGTAILEPVLLANKPLIFGQSAALTGPYSAMGAEFARGLRAAFNKYNAANLNTRRNLLLISYDDEDKISLTLANVRDLVERQDIFAMVGADSYAATLAQLNLTMEMAAAIPMIGPLSGDEGLRLGDSTVVNVRASFDDQCAAVVATALGVNHCQSVGILVGLTAEDDAVLSAMNLALAYHRTQAAQITRYDPLALSGAMELLDANTTVDCLYINGAAADVAAAIVALKHSARPPQSFYVNDHIGPELLVAALKGDYDNVWISQAMPSPYINSSDSTAPNAAFVASYRAAITSLFPADAHVSYASIEGYLTGQLIATAMTSDPEQTPSSFMSNLYSLGVLSLDGLSVGPYQRVAMSATSSSSDTSATNITASTAATVTAATACNQGYATVTMTTISATGELVQEIAYAVPSTFVDSSSSASAVPLVKGVGSTGVCGVSIAYMNPACPVNSQKVYLSDSTTAYRCNQCAMGQSADGSTLPCVYPTEATSVYTTAIIGLVSALLIVVTLAVIAAVYALRKRAELRAASPLFLVLILVGVLLALIAVILVSQSPLTSAYCESGAVLGHVAYALSFGALVAKTSRLAAIFNQRRVKVLKISDCLLAFVLGALLLLLSVYLTVWLAVDPPAATVVVNLSSETQTILCQSRSASWSIVLVALEAALLLYTLSHAFVISQGPHPTCILSDAHCHFLLSSPLHWLHRYGMVTAYRCRHNPEAFNETRLIAVIFYNSAVIGAATIGVLYAVALSSYSTTVLVCASLLVVSATLVAVLFGPKFYQIYSHSVEQVEDPQQQHSHYSSYRQHAEPQAAKSPHIHSKDRLKSTVILYGSPSSAIGFRSIAAQSTDSADRTWMEAPNIITGRSNSTAQTELMRTEEEKGKPQQPQQQQQAQQQQQPIHVRSPTSSRAIQLQPQKTASPVAVESWR